MSKLTGVFRNSVLTLNDTLSQIASGKKYPGAADSIVNFTKTTAIDITIRKYDEMVTALSEAKTVTDAAVNCGSLIYEDLTKMKRTAESYINEAGGPGDSDKLAAYKADFDSLKVSVVKMLQNETVDGNNIMQSGISFKTVSVDPENNNQMSIVFSAVPDEGQIDTFNVTAMTDSGAIKTQIENAQTYLSEARSFSAIIDRQTSLAGIVLSGKESLRAMINDIDEAKVTSEAIDKAIRLDIAGAMIAQGYVEHVNSLDLYSRNIR